MKFKDLIRRITGVGVPIFSIQWDPPPDEKRIAGRVLDTLANRRIFYVAYHLENEHACLDSANDLRDQLKQHLDESPLESIVYQHTKILQAAARKLVTELEELIRISPPQQVMASRFYDTLHDFRSKAGHSVACLAAAYGLDVEDELATIVPYKIVS